MEILLNNLSQAFNNYIKYVDNLYIKQTKSIDTLFGHEKRDLFCRAIYYIVRRFLESEDNEEQLFIKIPADELASRPGNQDENLQKMQDAICHALATAVYPQKGITATPLSDKNLEEIYYTSDSIRCNKGEARPRLWKIVRGKNTGRIYPHEQYPDTIGNRTLLLGKAPDLQRIFQEHLANTYKLAVLPENNSSSTRKKLAQMANLLQLYQKNQTEIHYKNALLVGYGSTKKSLAPRICDIPYIAYPLTFEKKYSNVSKNHYDIIVFAGDAKYNGLEFGLNNELAYGNTRKIIYIGSEAPVDYHGQEFVFSSRELYHYFANDKFPTFKVHKLHWEELTQLVTSLYDILNEESLHLDSDIIKRSITYTVAPYIGYSFFRNIEPLDERLLDFLNENFSISDEQWQSLINAVDDKLDVEFRGNPKKSKFDAIRKECGGNKCVLLEAYSSYSNKIKEACWKNKIQNSYVVDVCSDTNSYIEVVKCLLKKLALGTFHLLSYTNLEKIQEYLQDEYKYYNTPYRKSILDNLEYSRAFDKREQAYGSLDNFEFSLLDDLISTYSERNLDTTYYTLTSDNHDQYDVRGELIRNNQKIKACDLHEYAEDWLPCEISFYVKPSCFQKLRDILYDLPQGEDIETYANLWKERLRIRCESVFAGDYKTMWQEDNFKFIKPTNFRNFTNGTYQHMFPNAFPRLASRMRALGLLTEKELAYSFKAQVASKQSRSLGGDIKKGVYEYMLKGECNVAVVNTICENSRKWPQSYTLDDLKQLCIKSAKIENIIKSNRNHNEDE